MTRETRTRAEPALTRHWRVPPPLLRDAESPGPMGLNVLKEFPSELGTLLWRTLRTSLTWAQTSPGEREDLYPSNLHDRRVAEILALDVDEEIEEPLMTLAAVTRNPERVDPSTVGLACSRVGRWAEQDGRRLTAVEFYQAAAVACPSDAWYALQMGRAARDRAQHSRAEAWLQRAVGLSRQSRDWDTYIRAYIALGNLMRRKGAYPAARRNFLKALRRATRQGLRNVEGMALHDLFVLEEECSNPETAREYARRAVKAYGPGHRLLPQLAHDIGYYWLQRGYYAPALSVFFQVLPRLAGHAGTIGLGSIARASGATGDQRSYAWAKERLEELAAGPGLAEAWVETARGSLALGLWDEARDAAGKGKALAAELGEKKVLFLAEGVLQAIHAEERAAVQLRESTQREADAETRTLQRELIHTLQTSPIPR